MIEEAGRLSEVALTQKQRPIAFGMLLEQQRVVLEEAGARTERLALHGTWLRRVIDADVGTERNAAVFQRTPSKVGVFAARQRIELSVEAADGVKRLATEEQVGSHEPDPFEADVGHRTIAVVVGAIGDHDPLDADDARILEISEPAFEPVRIRPAVV